MKSLVSGIAGRALAAFALMILLSAIGRSSETQTILLWPEGAPGSEDRRGEPEAVRVTERGEHIVSNIHAPSLIAYQPERSKATGAAVVVIPGGGHTELWMDHEGTRVAEFLAAHGVAAFIVKYRLAHQQGSTYTVEGHALADVQRAIRLVRSQSGHLNIDPQRVGVMGFSAGGELAALASTRFDGGLPVAFDALERMSSRPDFQALLYPSIPRDMKVVADTPPAFLLCGADDQPAISQGLAELYLSIRRAGAHAELHIYDGVGHGFGLRAENVGPVAAWPQRFLEWLAQRGMIKRQ